MKVRECWMQEHTSAPLTVLSLRIECKQLLGMRYATQCVPPDRNEATFDGIHIGESRRHQDRLIDRTAHRRNPAHLVYRWAYDGKVEPFAAPDIAVEDLPDVQTEVHVGYWLAFRTAAFFQFGDALACSDCG